jgi:D-tyrosyl-tRNA(Tyr) deacylase
MIALIQRVSQARVEVEEQCIGSIGPGLLALIGIEREDDETACARLFEKITHYRVFGDEQGRMNRSLLDQGGELLLVSQFTLAADTRKGTRPGFSKAAAPERAKPLFDHLVRLALSQQFRPADLAPTCGSALSMTARSHSGWRLDAPCTQIRCAFSGVSAGGLLHAAPQARRARQCRRTRTRPTRNAPQQNGRPACGE